MARSALDVGVRRHQRVLGLGVICCRESRWTPALHGVTTLASALVRTLRELPSVLILVAISASLKRNLGFEVAALVAVDTRHLQVLSD